MTNLNTEIMKELVFWLIKVNLRQENKNKKRKSGLIDTVFSCFCWYTNNSKLYFVVTGNK